MSESPIVPPNKNSILELILSYISNTKPASMFLHLIWFTIVCATLSISYIFTTHFSNLLEVYQEAHNVQKFNSNLLFSMQQDRAINQTLTQLVKETNASRAYLFRYHNGLPAVSGVPFFFETNTHEVINPGSSRVIQYGRDLPASMNLNINNKFLERKCAVILNTDKDRSSQNYWFWQTRGARSLIRCPVFMPDGDLFGFVGIDFTDNIDQQNIQSYTAGVASAAKTISLIFASKH